MSDALQQKLVADALSFVKENASKSKRKSPVVVVDPATDTKESFHYNNRDPCVVHLGDKKWYAVSRKPTTTTIKEAHDLSDLRLLKDSLISDHVRSAFIGIPEEFRNPSCRRECAICRDPTDVKLPELSLREHLSKFQESCVTRAWIPSTVGQYKSAFSKVGTLKIALNDEYMLKQTKDGNSESSRFLYNVSEADTKSLFSDAQNGENVEILGIAIDSYANTLPDDFYPFFVTNKPGVRVVFDSPTTPPVLQAMTTTASPTGGVLFYRTSKSCCRGGLDWAYADPLQDWKTHVKVLKVTDGEGKIHNIAHVNAGFVGPDHRQESLTATVLASDCSTDRKDWVSPLYSSKCRPDGSSKLLKVKASPACLEMEKSLRKMIPTHHKTSIAINKVAEIPHPVMEFVGDAEKIYARVCERVYHQAGIRTTILDPSKDKIQIGFMIGGGSSKNIGQLFRYLKSAKTPAPTLQLGLVVVYRVIQPKLRTEFRIMSNPTPGCPFVVRPPEKTAETEAAELEVQRLKREVSNLRTTTTGLSEPVQGHGTLTVSIKDEKVKITSGSDSPRSADEDEEEEEEEEDGEEEDIENPLDEDDEGEEEQAKSSSKKKPQKGGWFSGWTSGGKKSKSSSGDEIEPLEQEDDAEEEVEEEEDDA